MGTQHSLPKREAEAGVRVPPIFGSWLLWPNGWMDQDGTWRGGRPWSSPHCARWGHSSPSKIGSRAPKFSARLYCGQTAGHIKMPLGTEVVLGMRDIVFDMDLATPRKRAHHSTQFLVHVYCGQMAGWMKTSLGTEVDLGPGHIVLDGVPAPAKLRGTAAPLFSAHVYCGHGRPSQLLLSSCSRHTSCTIRDVPLSWSCRMLRHIAAKATQHAARAAPFDTESCSVNATLVFNECCIIKFRS